MNIDEIKQLEADISEAIANASTSEQLESVRVSAVGKNGSIKQLLKFMRDMDPEQKREFGAVVNQTKSRIESLLKERKTELTESETAVKIKSEQLDVTLPVQLNLALDGRIHPVSRTMTEIVDIMTEMGFQIETGPDIETEEYNFNRLNIPADHPARSMHDTFYMANGNLLRTHTSNVQIRTMDEQEPPIRIIAPGRVYRCDSDASHSPMFHQCECLNLDKNIHLSHLKHTVEYFCREFFGMDDLKFRWRFSYFPFVTPGLELDINCSYSKDKLKIGEGNDWMEVLGCGMVHPNVLRMSGIDPAKYSGFAFGVGVDRLAMLKYGIPDLRDFFASDIRWLKRFGFRTIKGASS